MLATEGGLAAHSDGPVAVEGTLRIAGGASAVGLPQIWLYLHALLVIVLKSGCVFGFAFVSYPVVCQLDAPLTQALIAGQRLHRGATPRSSSRYATRDNIARGIFAGTRESQTTAANHRSHFEYGILAFVMLAIILARSSIILFT